MPLLFFTRRKARLFFCALGRKAGVTGLRPGTLWFFAALRVVRLFWQCLLGGGSAPLSFPRGKKAPPAV